MAGRAAVGFVNESPDFTRDNRDVCRATYLSVERDFRGISRFSMQAKGVLLLFTSDE